MKDNKQFESSEIDELVNVATEGLDIKVENVENAGTAEVENVEFNEAGNVILCCFAAFLLHLYFLDLWHFKEDNFLYEKKQLQNRSHIQIHIYPEMFYLNLIQAVPF